MQLGFRRQAGQAMTEFVVVASFVLVPAFLLLPMVGKLVDMKQASIQAARYMAWEYTAWNPGNTTPGMLDTFSAVPPPVKSSSGLGAEAAQRVFSDSELPVSSGGVWSQDTANPMWTGPKGQSLYVYGSDTKVGYSDQPVPDPLHLTSYMADVTNVMSTVMLTASTFLTPTGKQKFDAVQTGGYVTTNIAMPVLNVANLPPFDKLDLTFHAQAALVTRGWGAGGGKHTQLEVQGLVPAVLFNSPVIAYVKNHAPGLMKIVPIPDFGYVNTTTMTPDYLGTGSTKCQDSVCGGQW